MGTRKTLGVLVYLALLAIALILCWHEVKSYLDGNTDFSVSHEPLTMKDLPTLSICLHSAEQIFPADQKFIYGKNLLIYATILHTTIDTYSGSMLLDENKSITIINESLKSQAQ